MAPGVSTSLTSAHLTWLVNTGQTVTTYDGKIVSVFEFDHRQDQTVLSAWAKHFRNHYCIDTEIEVLCDGTGLSKRDYLLQVKFPDSVTAPGPSLRAGDFAEILLADYVEYVLNYWVPRTRYDRKTVSGESTKGTDVIGFKIAGSEESLQDTLILLEAKAKLSGRPSVTDPTNRLQDAVNDSAKDVWVRKAESLNAIKQRLHDRGDISGVEKVKRFQNAADRPYTEAYCAAALVLDSFYDPVLLSTTVTSDHPGADSLMLIIIKGQELMSLVQELYRRAADEA